MTEHLAKKVTDTCRMTHGNEDAVDRVLVAFRAKALELFAENSAERDIVYLFTFSSGKEV